MTETAASILIVEDSRPVRVALRSALQAAGYAVIEAADGQGGLDHADRADLVLLDIGLPDISGFEVLQSLRPQLQIPIIILSGHDEIEAKIRGLDLGADDYVTKPFDPGELLARVRAALRRQNGVSAAAGPVKIGPFVIDPVTGETRRGERPVRLSPMETRFVRLLAQRCGQPVGTRNLVQDLWGSDNPDQRQALRVLARKVRCKLEKDPDAPEYVLTEPKLGYRLVEALAITTH